jgi:hypothetical protein
MKNSMNICRQILNLVGLCLLAQVQGGIIISFSGDMNRIDKM